MLEELEAIIRTRNFCFNFKNYECDIGGTEYKMRISGWNSKRTVLSIKTYNHSRIKSSV
jgi:hypothetical protein